MGTFQLAQQRQQGVRGQACSVPSKMFFFPPSETAAAAAAKSLQSCPILCDPIDGSPPGSPVPGILQARTLEWVAISFANAWKWKVKVKSLSRVWLFATPWTAAYQAPPSMGFSRQEYWSGLPLASPWDLWVPAIFLDSAPDSVRKQLNGNQLLAWKMITGQFQKGLSWSPISLVFSDEIGRNDFCLSRGLGPTRMQWSCKDLRFS